jgi:hypothetical protein
MRTRTIRAWTVTAALGAVCVAALAPSVATEALAFGVGLAGVGLLAALDGLRERGMPRRRR